MCRRTLLLVLLGGCAGETSRGSQGATDAGSASAAAVETASKAPASKAPAPKAPALNEVSVPSAPPKASFGEETRGLRLRRSIVVRATPDLEGEKLGTVAAHTIVDWSQAARAPGCEERWINIVPRGWVCEGYLEPVSDSPTGVEIPRVPAGQRVPGTYGKVFGEAPMAASIEAGAIVEEAPIVVASTVRKRGSAMVDGIEYWKIDGGKYVSTESIREHKPSSYQGARLQDEISTEHPLAIAVSSKRPGDWVIVRDAPGGGRVRRLSPRAVVQLLEERKNSEGTVIGYDIAEGEFVARADLRLVELVDPPPLTGATERWFDVNLSTQILVAYEGATPVYTTLISSGTRRNPTETGIFRIWIKFSETSMSGRMGESDAYSVSTVPWTQFYENDFALHTSYWHDYFGQQRSHGCVNLSPRDARFLYFWSEPAVPIGWSMANASTERPGSMVRVHSKADPQPEFKGAALKVQQAREAAANN